MEIYAKSPPAVPPFATKVHPQSRHWAGVWPGRTEATGALCGCSACVRLHRTGAHTPCALKGSECSGDGDRLIQPPRLKMRKLSPREANGFPKATVVRLVPAWSRSRSSQGAELTPSLLPAPEPEPPPWPASSCASASMCPLRAWGPKAALSAGVQAASWEHGAPCLAPLLGKAFLPLTRVDCTDSWGHFSSQNLRDHPTEKAAQSQAAPGRKCFGCAGEAPPEITLE